MKHEAEIDKLLQELVYDKNSEMEYEEFIDIVFKSTGITKQKLSDNIEEGIKNGYSVEEQIKVIKSILKQIYKS